MLFKFILIIIGIKNPIILNFVNYKFKHLLNKY